MKQSQPLSEVLNKPGYIQHPLLPIQIAYRLAAARPRQKPPQPNQWRAAIKALPPQQARRIITSYSTLSSAGPGGRSWPDLFSYGFDFLLVVQSASLVEFLYRADFPFAYKGALLAVDGRPDHLKEFFLHAVRRHNLPVFIFHNLEEQPGRLRRRIITDLATRKIGPAFGQPVIDLGLWPQDALRLKSYIAGPLHRPAKGRPPSGLEKGRPGGSQPGGSQPGLGRNKFTFWERPLLRAGIRVHWAAFYPDYLPDLIGRGIQKELKRHYKKAEEKRLPTQKPLSIRTPPQQEFKRF